MEALDQRRQVIAVDLSKLEKQVVSIAEQQARSGRHSARPTQEPLLAPSLPQIYELESVYFTADYTNFGNVVKVRAFARRCRRRRRPSHQAPHPSLALLPFASAQGFNEFLTSKSAQAKNKNRQFRLEDRVFSLSSITSPGVRLHSSSASSWRVVADASCSGTAGIACMPTGMQFHTKASRLLPPCITLAPTLLRRPPTPAPPQTVEAQSNPTDQAAAAGVYIGPAAVPVQAARGVSQAPPPKRRY